MTLEASLPTQTRPADVTSDSTTHADFTMLRACLWSVCVYVGLGLTGFAVCAGFWPPPAASLNAAQIHQYFATHETGIKLGMILMATGENPLEGLEPASGLRDDSRTPD